MEYGKGGGTGLIVTGAGAATVFPQILPKTGSSMLTYWVVAVLAVLLVFGVAIVLRRLKPIQ